MEKAPEECILCGGTDRVPLMSDGKWSVRKCGRCGLGVLDPRPAGRARTAVPRAIS
jgi:hypothetical protein